MENTISATAFAAAMAPLHAGEKTPCVAVAVSGGADSMALVLLAQAWAKERQGSVIALTVDHRLRPKSSQEAGQVAAWMVTHGIPHRILVWEDEKPASNIQAAAREARYRLLTGWCRDNNIARLLLAHHLDDQAETVLMRLTRGSGVDGLAAIAPATLYNNVHILRPLLCFPKEALEIYLRERNQPWLDDSSNRNPAYDRARLREALSSLVDYPLLRQRLGDTAAHMMRAKRVLEAQAAQAMRTLVTEQSGALVLDVAGWRQLEEDTALRILAAITQRVGNHPKRPRFESLVLLYNEMRSPGFTSTRSFGCCLWTPSRKKGQAHLVTVTPEPK